MEKFIILEFHQRVRDLGLRMFQKLNKADLINQLRSKGVTDTDFKRDKSDKKPGKICKLLRNIPQNPIFQLAYSSRRVKLLKALNDNKSETKGFSSRSEAPIFFDFCPTVISHYLKKGCFKFQSIEYEIISFSVHFHLVVETINITHYLFP